MTDNQELDEMVTQLCKEHNELRAEQEIMKSDNAVLSDGFHVIKMLSKRTVIPKTRLSQFKTVPKGLRARACDVDDDATELPKADVAAVNHFINCARNPQHKTVPTTVSQDRIILASREYLK